MAESRERRPGNVGGVRGAAHHTYDERVQSLLDATLRVLGEHALGEITMAMIADEAGISRAWLYKFFPDLNSLYAELFTRMQPLFFHTADSPPPLGENLTSYMVDRCDTYLDLPVGCAILGAFAINGGRHTSPSLIALRQRILDTLEAAWVEPLRALGNDPDYARASVITVMNVICGLVVAVNQGVTTRDVACEHLQLVITALVSGLQGVS